MRLYGLFHVGWKITSPHNYKSTAVPNISYIPIVFTCGDMPYLGAECSRLACFMIGESVSASFHRSKNFL